MHSIKILHAKQSIFLSCLSKILIINICTLRKQALTTYIKRIRKCEMITLRKFKHQNWFVLLNLLESIQNNLLKKLVNDFHFCPRYSDRTLKYVAKMEKSSHYPIKDYSNEGDERYRNSCNCLHWALYSSILQNFPHE